MSLRKNSSFHLTIIDYLSNVFLDNTAQAKLFKVVYIYVIVSSLSPKAKRLREYSVKIQQWIFLYVHPAGNHTTMAWLIPCGWSSTDTLSFFNALSNSKVWLVTNSVKRAVDRVSWVCAMSKHRRVSRMPPECLPMMQQLAECITQREKLLDVGVSIRLDPWVTVWSKEPLEAINKLLLCEATEHFGIVCYLYIS